MDINIIYLAIVAGAAILIAANTVWKLLAEPDRLTNENLTDEDRAFVWRTTLFLVFPLVNLLALRSTIILTNMLGGFVEQWSYALLWYQAVPQGLPKELIIPAVFAGACTATILALLMIPALFFRPHPFLACLIGYSSVFILGLNLIVNPLLGLLGIGGSAWDIAMAQGDRHQLLLLYCFHAVMAMIYLAVVCNNRVRFWFCTLSRPAASIALREALAVLHDAPESAQLRCRIGLLYDRAGLKGQTTKQLKVSRKRYPNSIYTCFLEALVAYRQRNYKNARELFLRLHDYSDFDPVLKAALLAAAGCASFAAGEIIAALNLSERALEFDNACIVARMIKVDVFLRQGNREQAGQEILTAMQLGLALNIDDKVPLDTERAYRALIMFEERRQKGSWVPASMQAKSDRG